MRRIIPWMQALSAIVLVAGMAGPVQAMPLDGRLELGIKGAFDFAGDTDLEFSQLGDIDLGLEPTAG
ncbi:MAG: hypothetical protein ISR64_05410 [Deltaproteobacteria bacterium]|nr:hypothetical protein [Deltaproteobacteria bacterium]